MKKLKLIIEVVKFIGIIAHLLEAFDYIESFIKKRTQKKVVLCTLKNGKKFRNLLKKKVSKTKTE